jgi:hypothetical protein
VREFIDMDDTDLVDTFQLYHEKIPQTRIHSLCHEFEFEFEFFVFNATFNNISAISWRPVLVVEGAGVL